VLGGGADPELPPPEPSEFAVDPASEATVVVREPLVATRACLVVDLSRSLS
jgi:hypothetical protein